METEMNGQRLIKVKSYYYQINFLLKSKWVEVESKNRK